ncbi:type 1 glutamine amidotransferase domain-containing protein [Streptomyces halobius]|uniref:Type 1 glutamine amidotransferase n=1 Tax=Streptomyces halobius TaxID=2879846 RepID=A0ABY4LZF1_9ACTN|nr:type 1 glutamine amidotransferase domain-containing protein [Streptomyces halobius]UQA90833.1 type 1 glutamine amidotransferase [Streptomyces halobius]
MQIAFLVAPQGVEEIELTEPWQAVLDSGDTPHLISTRPDDIQAYDHLEKADTFPVDRTVGAAKVGDYVGLVLPGGVANPDALRMDKAAVKFVKGFFDAGKPVAAICHAPWTLIEADVVRGRTLTSWPSLQTDIRNAGGTWVDEQVKVCTARPNTLITSRKPGDLEAFCSTFLSEFSQAVQRV